jgi:hypothetical protein
MIDKKAIELAKKVEALVRFESPECLSCGGEKEGCIYSDFFADEGGQCMLSSLFTLADLVTDAIKERG